MSNMRTKRIFIDFPSGKRICLMWNNKDYISHIKDRIQGRLAFRQNNKTCCGAARLSRSR